MSQPRLGARLAAAAVAVFVPLSFGSASALGAPAQQPSAAPTDGGVPPMVVAPHTTIRGVLALDSRAARHRRIEVASAKGIHTWTASSLTQHDLPTAALRAYKHAARTIDARVPGCHLGWTLLAGIGRVESDHGRYGGSVLGADGVPRPAIIGIALDGAGPVAAVRDTDHGRFDGDKVWDRAVGPMQFIPSTWRTAGRDGDGDGVRSPNDIDDAALAAAAYLCHGGRDLAGTANQRAAVFSYNASDYYVDLVSAFAHGYATGVFVIPSPPVTPDAGDSVAHHRAAAGHRGAGHAKHAKHAKAPKARRGHHHGTHRTAPHPARKPSPKPSPKPSSKPSPKPSTKPSPKPSPKPPVLKTTQGPVTAAAGGWLIGGVKLTAADLSPIAAKDYDGDGAVEPVSGELDGLVQTGKSATLTYYDQPSFKVNGFST